MAISPGLEEGEVERNNSETKVKLGEGEGDAEARGHEIVPSPSIMPVSSKLEEGEIERDDSSSPVRVVTVIPSSPLVINASVQALGNCSSSANTNATPTLGLFPTGNAANGDMTLVINTSVPVQALGNYSAANTNATPALGLNQSGENVKDVLNGDMTHVVDIPKKKKKKKRKKKKSPLIVIGETSLVKRQRKDTSEYGPDPHLPITLGTATQSAPAAITSISSGLFGAPCLPSMLRPVQEPVQYTFGSTASAPSTSWSMHAPNFGAFSTFGPGPTTGSSAPVRFGTTTLPTPAAITSVSTEPAQPLGPNMLGAGASSTPTESAFGSVQTSSAITPAQSLGSTIFTAFRSMQAPSALPSTSTGPVNSHFSTISTSEFGTSEPSTFGSVRVSTGPAQSVGQNIFSAGVSGAPTPSTFGSVQAHSAISPVSTGPAQSLGQNIFGAGVSGAPTPSAIGSIQGSFGSGTFAAPVSSQFRSKQPPVKVSSGSSASAISLPMRSESAPAVTSASSAPAQALGGTTSNAFRTRITAFSSLATQGNSTALASGSLPADASTIHMPLINPSVLQATIGFDPFRTRTTEFSFRASQGNLTTSAPGSPRSVFGHTNAPFGTQLPSPVSATTFPTAHMPPVTSNVQTPNVSSPASRCTACGVSSGCFTSNDVTTPPLVATPLPGWFVPASSPAMFGTTPALQAYPVQGFVFLPSTSMNHQ